MKKSYNLISVILLAAFVFQVSYNIKWPWLLEMQQDHIYQQLTGFLVLLYIVKQWQLSFLRIKNKRAKIAVLNEHRILGVFAPLFFYFHSHSLGNNYLFLLSTLYLANFILGFLNPTSFAIKHKAIYSVWIISHVGMASYLIPLIAQHIYISYWYE